MHRGFLIFIFNTLSTTLSSCRPCYFPSENTACDLQPCRRQTRSRPFIPFPETCERVKLSVRIWFVVHWCIKLRCEFPWMESHSVALTKSSPIRLLDGVVSKGKGKPWRHLFWIHVVSFKWITPYYIAVNVGVKRFTRWEVRRRHSVHLVAAQCDRTLTYLHGTGSAKYGVLCWHRTKRVAWHFNWCDGSQTWPFPLRKTGIQVSWNLYTDFQHSFNILSLVIL